MANFTAADVKKLRDATGAGMMDCKKALEEADGDFDEAVEALRIKGAARTSASAAPSAPRPTAWSPRPRARCSSSTARPTSSPRTRSSSRSPPTSWPTSSATPAGVADALLGEPLKDGRTVAENIDGLSAVIGEKIELKRFVAARGPGRGLPAQAGRGPAAAGRCRSWSTPATTPRPRARRAMQIAAMRPRLRHPRRGARRDRRVRAPHRRGDRARGGQARGGPAQDRRGSGQRLLQGRRARSSSRRSSTPRRRSRRSSTRPASPSRASPASRSARPEITRTSTPRGRGRMQP